MKLALNHSLGILFVSRMAHRQVMEELVIFYLKQTNNNNDKKTPKEGQETLFFLLGLPQAPSRYSINIFLNET